jgi:hypothetical protein
MRISPRFIKIYHQAKTAEENGLDEVAGPGYGKALEFLIKDYLIGYEFTGDDEKGKLVRTSFLGLCINNFVTDQRIKDTARLAAWLRNDESHYVRKWEDRDLSHLKDLISLTVNWIDSTIRSDQYKKEMGTEK